MARQFKRLDEYPAWPEDVPEVSGLKPNDLLPKFRFLPLETDVNLKTGQPFVHGDRIVVEGERSKVTSIVCTTRPAAQGGSAKATRK